MEHSIKNTPLISVIVTVYNLEKYLDKCVDSIVNQTYLNLEIILVDDGSEDSSGRKCDEYANRDARIKVLHKRNEGAVSARKAGIEIATGDYIGFVDGDDWIENNMYELMVHACVEESVDIVSVENVREYEDGRSYIEHILLEEGVYKDEKYVNCILPNIIDTSNFFQWNIPMHGWQHIFRRELIRRNYQQIDVRIRRGEDMMFALSCYIEAHSVALIKKTLYHYRQIMNSARSTSTKKNLEGLVYLTKRLYEIAEKNERQKEAIYEQLKDCVLYTLLWSAYEVFLTEDDFELFPYRVERNKKIVIIGTGAFGKRLYNRINELKFCDIVAWIDNGWEVLQKQGMQVKGMEALSQMEFDYVVIAVLNLHAQEQLIKEVKRQNIDSEKIRVVNKEDMTEGRIQIITKRLEHLLKITRGDEAND